MLVFDDVTPLIRAQKVAAWREVARRLAHEIKNPLTPIQLSAERLRRHFGGARRRRRRSWRSAPSTIVGEVESLKGLVDEFSQFARMPAPRTVPTRSPRSSSTTRSRSTTGCSPTCEIEQRFDPERAARCASMPEQIRRVIINLMDNADRSDGARAGTHRGIETRARSVEQPRADRRGRRRSRHSGGERDKLFMPYYSTKRRGSGLGLAIVRRIVAEHGGSIEVGDNMPQGTRFTIELPCVTVCKVRGIASVPKTCANGASTCV